MIDDVAHSLGISRDLACALLIKYDWKYLVVKEKYDRETKTKLFRIKSG